VCAQFGVVWCAVMLMSGGEMEIGDGTSHSRPISSICVPCPRCSMMMWHPPGLEWLITCITLHCVTPLPPPNAQEKEEREEARRTAAANGGASTSAAAAANGGAGAGAGAAGAGGGGAAAAGAAAGDSDDEIELLEDRDLDAALNVGGDGSVPVHVRATGITTCSRIWSVRKAKARQQRYASG